VNTSYILTNALLSLFVLPARSGFDSALIKSILTQDLLPPHRVLGGRIPLFVGVVERPPGNIDCDLEDRAGESKRSIRWDYAKFLLSGKNLLAIGVLAVIEFAFVLVSPFLRHVMRCMHSARGEVGNERLVRRELLAVADEADRLANQVRSQVISLLRRLGRLDLAVITNEIGIILTGVGTDEAVVALETASERPAVEGPRRAYLLGRRQMPFTERVCVVALPEQNLG
jgi:hypothetical protein